jgi:hypothetical protein
MDAGIYESDRAIRCSRAIPFVATSPGAGASHLMKRTLSSFAETCAATRCFSSSTWIGSGHT